MELSSIFSSITDVEFGEQVDLTSYSTFKLKARGDLLIVKSLPALQKSVEALTKHQTPYTVLGLGANQIIKSQPDSLYLKLELPLASDILAKCQSSYLLPASILLNQLTSHAIKYGLKGWEVFTGIPATLGGAVCMNAGTSLGEIASLVKKVYIVKSSGELYELEVKPEHFEYRSNLFLSQGDVIYAVEMIHNGEDAKISDLIKEYLQNRRASQPLDKRTCGCIFKNYIVEEKTCRAGHYIDIVGLKGLTFDGMRVSPVHGNFFENVDGATDRDVMALINMVRDELKLQFGVEFEKEVKL
ncbi:MAG: FAD-binding protein [Bdellovibrionales bacterium]|nr:FAD-binding protein [Bdellovibrionales bacterium]MBT3526050.1 FAD-binding protein [Bdellovibrionales bacterium]MBT7668788.1 FAD-binding protein [Bdellovibrionales bacterium]MBT7767055.1 FAD-binding protein [Bdellovibrionales bacterium]